MTVEQGRGALALESSEIANLAREDQEDVVLLTQDLVRTPSRGGLDSYDPVVNRVSRWLNDNHLPFQQLVDEKSNKTVGITCDIKGSHDGPRYVLDACMDTAPFGDVTAWQHSPTSGAIEGDWLYGRGAADSKVAISIFLHVARRVRDQAQ